MVHWLELSVQTRRYVLVDAPPKPRCIILGFHGYAERPAHCLEGLRKAGVVGALLVGPMGPHQFYNRDGKVVTSWMTKFHREHHIEQILEFTRLALDQVEAQYGELPLFVFGFSQGASTAYRVATLAELSARRVFALAGDLPPEVVEALPELPPVAITILHGSDDLRVPAAPLEADFRRLQELAWPVEYLEYPGGHDYDEAAMALVGRRIEGDLASI